MLNFKIGDKVKVVKDLNGHGFEIGEEVKVVELFGYDKDDEHYECEGENGVAWFLSEEELELIVENSFSFTLSDLMFDDKNYTEGKGVIFYAQWRNDRYHVTWDNMEGYGAFYSSEQVEHAFSEGLWIKN